MLSDQALVWPVGDRLAGAGEETVKVSMADGYSTGEGIREALGHRERGMGECSQYHITSSTITPIYPSCYSASNMRVFIDTLYTLLF